MLAAAVPLIIPLRGDAPLLLFALPMRGLARGRLPAIGIARLRRGARARDFGAALIPLPCRDATPIAVARGGVECPGPRIIAGRGRAFARCPLRIERAPGAIVDDHQIAAGIGIAVIGIADVIRVIVTRLVIIIAIAAIDRLGEGVVSVAGLPRPGLDPAIVIEIIVGRRVPDHLIERIRPVDIGVIAAAGWSMLDRKDGYTLEPAKK